jgi:hypothetical protein
MHGIGEHHLKWSHPGSEDQKVHVLPHMQIVDLKQMHQYYRTRVTLRGGCAREGLGKGRKPTTWMRLMCSLYRNECRNFKPARATMGNGLGRSEKDWKRQIKWSCNTNMYGNKHRETPCVAIFISSYQKVRLLISSFMFFLLQNWRTGGRNRFCPSVEGGVVGTSGRREMSRKG